MFQEQVDNTCNIIVYFYSFLKGFSETTMLDSDA